MTRNATARHFCRAALTKPFRIFSRDRGPIIALSRSMTIDMLLRQLTKNFNINDLLGGVGLAPKRSAASYILPSIGLLSLGAIIGGACALLLTPKSGPELRGQIRAQFGKAKEQVETLTARTADNHHKRGSAHA